MKARVAVAALLLVAACKALNPDFEESGAGTASTDGTAGGDDDSTTKTSDSTASASMTATSPTSPSGGSTSPTNGTMSTMDTLTTQGDTFGSASSEDTGKDPLERCCEQHDTGGCAEPAIEQCVCEAKPACCDGPWGLECVSEAVACGAGCWGNCCARVYEAGCSEPAIEQCVCEGNGMGGAFCCESEWDAICVSDAESLCDIECPPAPCPEAHLGVGCDDFFVQDCVCLEEADALGMTECCEVEWTPACAAAAQRVMAAGGCGIGDP